MPRLRKFEPEPERMLRLPPLKPPRDASNGDVVSDVEIAASRGKTVRAHRHAVERDAVLIGAESEHGESVGRAVESGDERHAGQRRRHRGEIALHLGRQARSCVIDSLGAADVGRASCCD